ncbi:STY4528 family pathogenicity island replication protein [Sodalis sp. RH22]|uniref:STY4528 family pathogenicity island replication protein n=1 Tax=unclassified Sodalis (in: enterobacteria) TaxID=2636512 RepID=UPI0039B4693A
MRLDGTSQHHGSVDLSELFDDALRKVTPPPESSASSSFKDGMLYSGNRHESVPRALFLDARLTPLERNAWQVFRLQLNGDGLTAFPTYDQLRPWLASMPCGPQASHETVARALTLLRLTRWLSLVRRRRDRRSGRIQGNVYVLHDEPVTPFEAMQLDPDYLGLVSQSLTHAAKAVQVTGRNTLREIAADPLLSGRTLPTRLQVLAQRMARQEGNVTRAHEAQAVHESEDGDDDLLRIRAPLTSESEAGPEVPPDARLRDPKTVRTVRITEKEKEVRTVPRARGLPNLKLPERFLALKEEQQAGALVALQQVDSGQRQAVLDEWAVRCRRGAAVRNPAGYLFGIIQKAIRGEFKSWVVAQAETCPLATPSPASPSANTAAPPASREAALQHIARLRALLHIRSRPVC